MAKVKFSPRKPSRRDQFYMTGNLFDVDPAERHLQRPATPPAPPQVDLENDIHPSIADFIVNTRARQAEPAPSNEIEDMLAMSPDTASSSSTDRMTFLSFGSGSSGNCAYLGCGDTGLLIDAGIDPDTVRDGLRRHGINPRTVKGIIVTHDHSDHVKYAYGFVRKRTDMAIYCTPKTLSGLLRRHSISRRIKDYHRAIYKEFAFNIGPFEITPFETSHDGTDNVGYYITCGGRSLAIATDLGCITPRVDHYMRLADNIIIEANYDAHMLATGPYPLYLQARIAADRGHLDNTVTGAFLASIASERLRNIFLCHLSHDNNQPELALATVRKALAEAGFDRIGDASGSIESRDMPLQLYALLRSETSLLMSL